MKTDTPRDGSARHSSLGKDDADRKRHSRRGTYSLLILRSLLSTANCEERRFLMVCGLFEQPLKLFPLGRC